MWDKNKVICITRGVLATGTGRVFRDLKIVRRTQWRGRQIFFLNVLHVWQRLKGGVGKKRGKKNPTVNPVIQKVEMLLNYEISNTG